MKIYVHTRLAFVQNICNTLNFSLSKGRTVHVTATLNINEMKFSAFGHKDTTTKYNKIFENGFRNEGVAIHLFYFGRYLILLNEVH